MLNRIIKATKSILFCLITLIFVMSTNSLYALDTEENPIYYEEEELENEEIYTGIIHRKVSAFSMVTDNTQLNPSATEAGYGNSVPITYNKYYSQQVNYLEIANDSKAKLVPWGQIENGTWSLQKVTDMAADYERSNPGWKVVAAVNGDFFDINGVNNYRYCPSGAMISDGETYKAAISDGWNLLGVDNNATGKKLTGYTGKQVNDNMSENLILTVYNDDGSVLKKFDVTKNNQVPADNEIAAYYPVYDSNHKLQPVNVEEGFIVEKCIDSVPYSEYSYYGKGTISMVGSIELKNNQFAVVSKNQELTSLLKVGVTIRVQRELTNEMASIDCGIGFCNQILTQGVVTGHSSYDMDRMPRTLIGQKEDGTIMMVVVDGRQAQLGYYGIGREEETAILNYYGFSDAYQFDGGGSATMVVLKNGELVNVNSPSDSSGEYARSDSNCLLVAVYVPTIEYEVVTKYDSLDFTVDVIKMIDGYEDLYIDVNGEKKKITDGKCSFGNLDSYTDYVYKFYSLVDGEYVTICYQGKVNTAKITPTISAVYIEYSTLDGVSNYVVTIDYTDTNDAILSMAIQIDGKSQWASSGVCTYSTSRLNIASSDNWFIRITYNLEDGKGQKNLNFTDVKVVVLSSVVQMDAIKENVNSSFVALLEK